MQRSGSLTVAGAAGTAAPATVSDPERCIADAVLAALRAG